MENTNISGSKTLGELVAFGFLGLFVFSPLFYYFFQSKDRQLNIISQDLFIMFMGLLFFGIGVDILHDLAEVGTITNGILGLTEDAGEMIIMSSIVWYTWVLVKFSPFAKIKPLAQQPIKTPATRKIYLKDHPPVTNIIRKHYKEQKKS